MNPKTIVLVIGIILCAVSYLVPQTLAVGAILIGVAGLM